MTAFNFGPDPAAAPALRWGIIGPGGIARRFAAEIPADTASSVVSVGSRDLGRAQQFAAEFNIPQAYGSYEELVADPQVDAVYIASPHSSHREHATLALRAGKPVLVEKAFTTSVADSAAVFALARERGLFAMEAMWTRFLPHMVAIRQLVQDGALGDLVSGSASHGQALTHVPRMVEPGLGGGAMLDLGVYPAAFLQDMLGTPVRVSATGWRWKTGVDATVAVTLEYPLAVGQFTTTLLAQSDDPAQLVGTGGHVWIDHKAFRPSSFTFTPAGGEPVRVDPPSVGGFAYQAAEVARCIAAGEVESTVMPWQDTLAVAQLMEDALSQIPGG